MEVDYTILIHAIFITVAICIIIIQFTYFSVNVDSLEKQIQALIGRIRSLEEDIYEEETLSEKILEKEE
jgi:cell division protein FtsL